MSQKTEQALKVCYDMLASKSNDPKLYIKLAELFGILK